VHTAEKEELELTTTYHQFAEQFEVEGFVRIATTLRALSESYKRESEREAKQNPYQFS
jgi:rubrerythrin